MHLLNDTGLAVAVSTALHGTLLHHLTALVALSRDIATDNDAVRVRQQATPSELDAMAWLSARRVPGTQAYVVPFLDPKHCARILVESSSLPYTSNKMEADELQTAECVLADECPQLGRAAMELMAGALYPVMRLVYGTVPRSAVDVHLTRYAANGGFQGVWHNDNDSDITVVVELNPDSHVGGKTRLMAGPLETVDAPVLAAGEALIFPGKTTLHCGAPLRSGVRDLLVYWMETKDA